MGKIIGRMHLVAVGVVGSLWSSTIHPSVVVVGGSGLTALIGADAAFVIYNFPDVSGATAELVFIALDVAFNLALSLSANVDLPMYIGGTICGALLGCALLPKITERGAFAKQATIASSVALGIMILIFSLVLWVGKPS